MTANDAITELLSAPLAPDWTVDRLAEDVLCAFASEGDESSQYVLDGEAISDRQSRRLLRPLLACLATKSAAEAGAAPNLYGGRLTFQRTGKRGPVWIVGQFENTPGTVRVAFRRLLAPPERSQSADAGSRAGTEFGVNGGIGVAAQASERSVADSEASKT